MSWLRDHFFHFVFPAFVAAEKKSTEIGEPFHIMVSKHAPERLPTELQKLWTLCAEHGVPWSYDVRMLNTHGGMSKFRKTARIHNQILRETATAAASVMRREGCSRLLLPGRDIYMLVPILAHRRVPFLFVPELSRPNSTAPAMRGFLEHLGVTGAELVVDTGFVGSIPANMNKLFPGRDFKFRLMSEQDKGDPRDRFYSRPHQFFPNRKGARAEAVESEYLSKYWKSGTTDESGAIVQYLADKRSIQRAALLTSMLFRGIPYWKVQPSKEKQAAIFQNSGTGWVPLQGMQGVFNPTAQTIVYGSTASVLVGTPLTAQTLAAHQALVAQQAASQSQVVGLQAAPSIHATPPAPAPVAQAPVSTILVPAGVV
jgi:hypothetical protein